MKISISNQKISKFLNPSDPKEEFKDKKPRSQKICLK